MNKYNNRGTQFNDSFLITAGYFIFPDVGGTEMTLTTTVDQTMVLHGDKYKLKDLLRQRLNECGWRDEVRLLCRNAIKDKGGSINVDQIVQEVTPKARARVPDAVKKELLMKIKASLAAQEAMEF